MLKLLELFSEGLIYDNAKLVRKTLLAEKETWETLLREQPHSFVTDAGGDPCAEDEHASASGTKRASDSKPEGDRNVFTHFPRDPNCVVLRITAGPPRPQKKVKQRLLKRAEPTTLGELIAAHHKILNLDDESRHGHWNALIVQDGYSYWSQSHRTKTQRCSRLSILAAKLSHSFRKPGRIFTDEGVHHDTNTRHRSDTNGIAERAVRREQRQRWFSVADPMNGVTV